MKNLERGKEERERRERKEAPLKTRFSNLKNKKIKGKWKTYDTGKWKYLFYFILIFHNFPPGSLSLLSLFLSLEKVVSPDFLFLSLWTSPSR